jgi:lysyl-tRNA synthetase class 2
MATLKELRDERLRKLEELKKLGVNPYPASTGRDHSVAEVLKDYKQLEGKGTVVTIAGRITNIRKFGKIAFVVVRDAQVTIQLFLSADEIGAPDYSNSELGFDNLNLLDSGDFIEVTGVAATTKTGEQSVTVNKLRLLTKSLRSMPTAQDGFTNKEERLRRRYVDTNVNKDVYERFIRRSKFWQATRDFLNEEGFIEINIPVLEHTTGGADANPFVTHMDAINQDFYLRISHELPLKRLIGGGYEKVYDIGPRFRNENYTDEHLPEHIAMEWYAAYWDWQQGINFMTRMYRHVLKETFGTLQFKLGDFQIDLSKDWEQWDYAETIKKRYGIDVFDCTLDEVKRALADNQLEVEQTENKARGIDKLWKNIRKDVAGPIWLINTPKFISPLSKTNPNDPNIVERFQPVIAGSELGNGWSELNDPIDQLDRFLEQQSMRDAGDNEAQMLDIDFVEMLEYGMPPACGWGFSERVFWIFEGVTAREGVPFPQLRSDIDEVTKGIYPEVFAGQQRSIGKSRPQDFSKRIITVVNKDLEPWQVANAVAHMDAIIGNELPKDQLTSGDVFSDQANQHIPRNSQYPIIVMRASEKDLHKLRDKVIAKNLVHHVFIKEMQDTNNDQEIIDSLKEKSLEDTIFYGVSFIASNEVADKLTAGLQLWK